MFFKLILLSVLVGVNCRYILEEDYALPVLVIDEVTNLEDDNGYEGYPDINHGPRVRRGQASMTVGSDGIVDNRVKIPVTKGDDALSVTGSLSSTNAVGAGLALDTAKGHSLSLSGKRIPGFGDQLTAAGTANLFHSDKHDLRGTAFVSRNMPKVADLPNFNTAGGRLDYTYNDKIGGSLTAARTDLFKQTDVSAMGNLNLFRSPTSSFDFSAGAARSFSPYIPKSSWEPRFDFTFSKFW